MFTKKKKYTRFIIRNILVFKYLTLNIVNKQYCLLNFITYININYDNII